MKKRLIGLLLCIAMIFSAIPMLALADDGVAELPLDDILAEKKFEDVTSAPGTPTAFTTASRPDL